jgi:hypothetical protein
MPAYISVFPSSNMPKNSSRESPLLVLDSCLYRISIRSLFVSRRDFSYFSWSLAEKVKAKKELQFSNDKVILLFAKTQK